MSDSTEVWKPIPEFEDLYAVSNMGRVKRSADGSNAKAGKILKPRPTQAGYHTVALYRNAVPRQFSVHGLVMAAFCPEKPEHMQINHINGIKGDNRLCNLEYVTASENMRHAISLGLLTPTGGKGERHGKARLSESQVKRIRAMKGKLSIRKLAAKYGVGKTTIEAILTGRTWTHI